MALGFLLTASCSHAASILRRTHTNMSAVSCVPSLSNTQVASPANTTPVRAPGAPLVGHSRRLLAGANNAGLSVSAQTPLDPEVPADQLLHPTVTKTLVGTGNDTTACEYVSVPDAATGAQITQ